MMYSKETQITKKPIPGKIPSRIIIDTVFGSYHLAPETSVFTSGRDGSGIKKNAIKLCPSDDLGLERQGINIDDEVFEDILINT